MTDTTTRNQLAAEIHALREENERLKATIAGTDCTLCGCIRQSCADKKPKRDLIYVASPYGGIHANYARAQRDMMRLTETYKQYDFVSPIVAYGYCYDQYSYEDGINQCYGLLSHCNQLWILHDDGKSRGVKLEREYAERHGIPVREVAE